MKIFKKTILKNIIIGLAIGTVIFAGYYFFDYQSRENKEEVVGISKEKVLLGDEKIYEIDVILNSVFNNQFVLQESIQSLNEKINSLEEKIKLIEEQKNDNNQSE